MCLKKKTFVEKYGPWAIVTGCSSGIGKEFCEVLASKSFNVVLVARREKRLEELSEHLKKEYKVNTRVLPCDLSDASAINDLVMKVSDLDIGLLVNNAGVGFQGSFFNITMENYTKLISVNVNAVVQLTKEIGARIVRRGHGGIILVSSMASRCLPYGATYSASKSFLNAFSQSLQFEIRNFDVDVLCVQPGLTNTEMLESMELLDYEKFGVKIMSPRDVAQSSLRALRKKKKIHIPGSGNRVSLKIFDCLPIPWSTALMGFAQERAFRKEALVPNLVD